MFRKTLIAAASAAALLGGGAAVVAAAGAASAATTYTQTTSVTNRDDSGFTANFAIDTLSRVSTVSFVQQTSGSACEDLSPCYEFTGSIADTGTFAMDPGAGSPNTGADVTGDPSGPMSGGSGGFTFYADAMPTTTPASAVSGDVPSTGDWLKGFFASGTDFVDPSGTEGSGAYLLGSAWSWTYSDLKNCQQWTDASTETAGAASNGDLTGTDSCTTSVTSPGNESSDVGTPVSLQIAGSTTSSDKALTYAATGLPAGLSMSTAGLVTGTPTTAETTDVVTVTAKDFGGLTGSATFGWTVSPATIIPPPATKMTARYVCGRSQSRVVWVISNVQGAGPAIANFTARVGSHWAFDGSASIALKGSHRLTTSAGKTLKVYYDANGSRPAPKEAGALSVTATAPLNKRCG